eukprot:TRINITY_DN16171_c0_g2_i1.p1 TRINITY_DN16171_c0_g2~~TRINITY_DN16171_c0_g2_i1.p1  ORF type:complete len:65 (+),score=1.78 TRINITY_DN16171_c0_g2_i1:216-410(+)
MGLLTWSKKFDVKLSKIEQLISRHINFCLAYENFFLRIPVCKWRKFNFSSSSFFVHDFSTRVVF